MFVGYREEFGSNLHTKFEIIYYSIIVAFLIYLSFLNWQLIIFITQMTDQQNFSPNWDEARKHGKANLIGEPQSLCQCCNQFIKKKPIPLSANLKQLEVLGFEFPLFYIFLKKCIILLLVSICSYSAMALKFAIVNNYDFCYPSTQDSGGEAERSCHSFMILFSRLETSISVDEQILRVTSFIIQLMFLIYMRNHILKLQQYYGERSILLSDFSVLMENIQKKEEIEKGLQDIFIKLEPQKKTRDVIVLPEQEQIKAIVIFNTKRQRQDAISKFRKMQFSTLYKYFGQRSKNITIEQAPQPKEIIWENLNIPQKSRHLKYMFAWTLTLLALGILTICAYYMYNYKRNFLLDALNDYSKDPGNPQYEEIYKAAISVVYLALLIIIMFNKFVMSTIFHKITQFEKHKTRSKQQLFFGIRYSIGLFFTTSLMILIVQAVIFQNYYSQPYGVIQEESIMFVLNAFFVPLYWMLNPPYLLKKVKRCIQQNKKGLTQTEANKLMKNPQYDMVKRYAQIIQTMWFTFLYSTLLPIGQFISILGLVCYYWVDKFNLLRRSSLGGGVSGKIAISSMKLLDFTLLLKPLGQLVFDLQLRHEISKWTIAFIAIAGLYLLLPVDRIIKYGHDGHNFCKAERTYDEIIGQLKKTYRTENPVYMTQMKQKFQRNSQQMSETNSKRTSLLDKKSIGQEIKQ